MKLYLFTEYSADFEVIFDYSPFTGLNFPTVPSQFFTKSGFYTFMIKNAGEEGQFVRMDRNGLKFSSAFMFRKLPYYTQILGAWPTD